MCGLSVISLFSIEVKGKVFFFFIGISIRDKVGREGQVQNRFKGRFCQGETRQRVMYIRALKKIYGLLVA